MALSSTIINIWRSLPWSPVTVQFAVSSSAATSTFFIPAMCCPLLTTSFKTSQRLSSCVSILKSGFCRRDKSSRSSTSNSRGAGGYRYLVELYANGRRLELETNDAFWFRHDKDKGKVLQVWYNPNARCVERKSWETEFFAAVLAVIGAALLLIR